MTDPKKAIGLNLEDHILLEEYAHVFLKEVLVLPPRRDIDL